MSRKLVGFALAAIVALSGGPAWGQEGSPAMRACIARYEKLDQQMKWIRLDTVSTTTPEIPLDEFYELNGIFDFVPHYGSVVLANDGRTFLSTKWTAKSLSGVSTLLSRKKVKIKLGPKGWWPEYAQAKEEFANVKPEENFETRVFDGKNLMERKADALSVDGKPLDTLSIVNVERLKSTFFVSVPLEYFLVTFPIPAAPLDDARRKGYRIVDLAKEIKLKVLSEAEEVNGYRCLKLAFDKNVVWLAPKLNFALVKIQSTVEGHLIYEIDGEEYKNWGDDFWFPTRYTATSYGYPKVEIHPARYLDKPISKTRTVVSKLQINDPADEKFFTHGPEASDLVMDEMLAKEIGVEKEGRFIPTVGYQAPEKPEDLEKTRAAAIANASAAAANRIARRVRLQQRIGIALTGGSLLLILVIVLFRARRRHLRERVFEYKP